MIQYKKDFVRAGCHEKQDLKDGHCAWSDYDMHCRSSKIGGLYYNKEML